MTKPLSQSITGLLALEQRIEQDFSWLNLPLANWIISEPHPELPSLDVAIIGAGMSGLTAALALYLNGVNAILFDKNSAGLEGPWLQPALMQTLRSPKEVVGPVLGSAALSFQAWFKAQFGDEQWHELDKIPRQQWAEYLQWYKQQTKAVVHNQHELVNFYPEDNGLILVFKTDNGEKRYFARRVIFALGMDAFGERYIPEFTCDIAKSKWIHSYDVYSYKRLKNKRIAVIGGGSAAMDTAATALEVGANRVDILIRGDDFPRVNLAKQSGCSGLDHGHRFLTDSQKWQFASQINTAKCPPPRGSTLRVSKHTNAFFNFSCPINSIEQQENSILIQAGNKNFEVDFVIVATGYKLNWKNNPTFANLAKKIKKWVDVYQPSFGTSNPSLAEHPYLTDSFGFIEKVPNTAPELNKIYCFSYPALVSAGPIIGLIAGINQGATRLANHITGQFYQENFQQHLQKALTSQDAELLGDEWVPA